MGFAETKERHSHEPNHPKEKLVKCDCWAAREGKDESGHYVYCMIRAMFLSSKQSRIRTNRELKRCPGHTQLKANLEESSKKGT